MCFADKNNIYIHDGTKPNPISVPISSGDTKYSWQNIDFAYSPKVVFYNKMKCFVIVFKTTGGVYSTWSYNMVMNRWDLFTGGGGCSKYSKHRKPPSSFPRDEVVLSKPVFLNQGLGLAPSFLQNFGAPFPFLFATVWY